MKRWFATLLIPAILLLNGCGFFSSDRVGLFNNWFSGSPSTVTVKKGDTLYSISRKYNVPLRDVIEVNNLKPPYTLRIGQVLKIPSARYHIVAKGDTLYNISKRYEVDVTSLSKINNINPPYTLSIGQKLILPGSVAASSYAGSSQSAYASSSSSQKTSSSQTQKYSPSPVTTSRKTKFDWPLKGTITSKFGTIGKGRTNDGINIKASLGSNVKAADSGTVAYSGNELKGFGNLVLIKHNDGWITAYAHLDRIVVKKGQKVARGEKIGTVGNTGGVNTPQLHFEVRSGKKALDPLNYLP